MAWRDYSDRDVTVLKRRQCVKCDYLSTNGAANLLTHTTCDYILDHKHIRGCPPYECVEKGIFKPRTTRRRKNKGRIK